MNQVEDKLFSPSEIIQILNIPRHKLNYLFDTRKLKSEEFLILGNGRRVFRYSDINKIKQALFQEGCR